MRTTEALATAAPYPLKVPIAVLDCFMDHVNLRLSMFAQSASPWGIGSRIVSASAARLALMVIQMEMVRIFFINDEIFHNIFRITRLLTVHSSNSSLDNRSDHKGPLAAKTRWLRFPGA